MTNETTMEARVDWLRLKPVTEGCGPDPWLELSVEGWGTLLMVVQARTAEVVCSGMGSHPDWAADPWPLPIRDDSDRPVWSAVRLG